MGQQSQQQQNRQQNRTQEPRIAVEAENGHIVWIPQSKAAAFLSGQRKQNRGLQPSGKEQLKSELMSMLTGARR